MTTSTSTTTKFKVERSPATQAFMNTLNQEQLEAFYKGYSAAKKVGEKAINKAIATELKASNARAATTTTSTSASNPLTDRAIRTMLELQQQLNNPNLTSQQKAHLRQLQSAVNQSLTLSSTMDQLRPVVEERSRTNEAVDRGFETGTQKACDRLLRNAIGCYNPGCGKDAVTSDIVLKTCSVCKQVWYCSKPCQVAHWKSHHKAECISPSTSTTSATKTNR